MNELSPATEYQTDFQPSERDLELHKLVVRYHNETEAYDRTVCTGPIISDEIFPRGPHELALINRNASKVFQVIRTEAEQLGIQSAELWRAIGRYSSMRGCAE